ncbi:MAG: nuclear transport factor 2 family protein [Bacteroidales bacterium]
MKRLILLICLCSVSLFVNAQENNTNDIENIKSVIQTSYIDGIQNLGKIKDIKKGFHKEFELLSHRGEDLHKLPLETWIGYVKKAKKNNVKMNSKITCSYKMIDITGDAAIVKLELNREDKHLYTDYLSLYKFPEGWKIVGKTYQRF